MCLPCGACGTRRIQSLLMDGAEEKDLAAPWHHVASIVGARSYSFPLRMGINQSEESRLCLFYSRFHQSQKWRRGTEGRNSSDSNDVRSSILSGFLASALRGDSNGNQNKLKNRNGPHAVRVEGGGDGNGGTIMKMVLLEEMKVIHRLLLRIWLPPFCSVIHVQEVWWLLNKC